MKTQFHPHFGIGLPANPGVIRKRKIPSSLSSRRHDPPCVNQSPSKADYPKGFALIATLSLLILLFVIAVGMLSLSAVGMRSSGASSAQATANANARLALMLAIGELQKNLGPDKRTSATAELLGDDSNNPNWVGAWNTEGGFRSWLVSGNENIAQPTDPATDATAIPYHPGAEAEKLDPPYTIAGKPAALLVGSDTVGKSGTPAEIEARKVVAPLVDIIDSKSTPEPITGRYAWWVGDEGVKANLAAPVKPLPASSAGVSERIEFLGSSPNRGFPTLGTAWKNWLPTPEGTLPDADVLPSKLVSHNQVALADPSLVTSQEDKARFHDFTTYSSGVLSDSKNGGLRKDLSIAFEIPDPEFRDTEFTRKLTEGEINADLASATDHDASAKKISAGSPFKGRSTKTAINYQDPEWPDLDSANYDPAFPLIYRGPTFDQLRDHYRV